MDEIQDIKRRAGITEVAGYSDDPVTDMILFLERLEGILRMGNTEKANSLVAEYKAALQKMGRGGLKKPMFRAKFD